MTATSYNHIQYREYTIPGKLDILKPLANNNPEYTEDLTLEVHAYENNNKNSSDKHIQLLLLTPEGTHFSLKLSPADIDTFERSLRLCDVTTLTLKGKVSQRLSENDRELMRVEGTQEVLLRPTRYPRTDTFSVDIHIPGPNNPPVELYLPPTHSRDFKTLLLYVQTSLNIDNTVVASGENPVITPTTVTLDGAKEPL